MFELFFLYVKRNFNSLLMFAISALHIKPLIDGKYCFCTKLMLF